MDIITGALLAGIATTATTETVKAGVKDAYEALKTKLKQWFLENNKPEGEMVLAKIEKSPDNWKMPLGEVVIETGADKNEAIVQAAHLLIKVLEETPEGNRAISKYNITAPGSQIGIIGDNTHIEGGIHLSEKGKKNYPLTDMQKDCLRLLVQHAREKGVEEFHIVWHYGGAKITEFGKDFDFKESVFDILHKADLVHSVNTKSSQRRCTITQKAYDNVDSNFSDYE